MERIESERRTEGGPYRLIRAGEIVTLSDVTTESGRPLVPERKYGGRRTKLSAIIDRRQS